jgi:hypothetical protein
MDLARGANLVTRSLGSLGNLWANLGDITALSGHHNPSELGNVTGHDSVDGPDAISNA